MSIREDKQDATNDAQIVTNEEQGATNDAQIVTNEDAVRRLIKLEQPPRLTWKEWGLIVLLFFVSVVGVHQYDNASAHDAATVVYKNGLLNCEGGNPTRKAQHEYFVSIAVGRSAEAKADDRPQAKKVDQGIARVAYHTAKTYTNRFGARPDGTLICSKVVTHP